MTTEKVYIGYSKPEDNNPTYKKEMHPLLKKRIEEVENLAISEKDNEHREKRSFEPWPVNNCAEIIAANRALLENNNLQPKDLFFDTRVTKTGAIANPCRNCTRVFREAVFVKTKEANTPTEGV